MITVTVKIVILQTNVKENAAVLLVVVSDIVLGLGQVATETLVKSRNKKRTNLTRIFLTVEAKNWRQPWNVQKRAEQGGPSEGKVTIVVIPMILMANHQPQPEKECQDGTTVPQTVNMATKVKVPETTFVGLASPQNRVPDPVTILLELWEQEVVGGHRWWEEALRPKIMQKISKISKRPDYGLDGHGERQRLVMALVLKEVVQYRPDQSRRQEESAKPWLAEKLGEPQWQPVPVSILMTN
jgi:hypothetical protein